MDKAKSISTPMHLSQVLETDKDGEKFSDKLYKDIVYDMAGYCDADFVRDRVEKKKHQWLLLFS